MDAGTDRVYQYSGAASRIFGQQAATLSFDLNAADGNPQGIADPRAVNVLDKIDNKTLNALVRDNVAVRSESSHEGRKDVAFLRTKNHRILTTEVAPNFRTTGANFLDRQVGAL